MDGKAGWKSELETAIAAAREAGRVLQSWVGRFSVDFKGPNDLVTEADHEAQEAVRRVLTRQFPEDDFLGEEGDPEPSSQAPRRWIVDPLDGTTNFVHGFPFYCVSIALEVAGRPVVGVVFDPNRNECFAASARAGARCNGTAMRASASDRLSRALLCVGLPYETTDRDRIVATFGRLSLQAQSVHRLGSAALALAYVACGRFDGYWTPRLNPWDCAAGALLVQEAGGRVTNQDGSSYDLYTPDILATNGLIHHALTEEVASRRSDQVQ